MELSACSAPVHENTVVAVTVKTCKHETVKSVSLIKIDSYFYVMTQIWKSMLNSLLSNDVFV